MQNEFYNDTFEINWADETNSEVLTAEKLGNPNYTLIQVNIEDCFRNTSDSYRLDIESNDGGKNAIGDRLKNAKEHFMSGNPMDYPIVEYDFLRDEIAFTNGRHRTLAASHMGCNYIPMLVYNGNGYLDEFKSMVRTKEMDQPLDKPRYVDNTANKININWANEEQSTEVVKNIFKNDSHVLLQVNVEKAFANIMDSDTEENLYFKPGRTEDLSERIGELKNSFLNKESIDFPTIASNKEFDSVNITSGKETIMAAYDLGCKFVPMLVDKKDLSHFQSIIETKEMNERLESPTIEKLENDVKEHKQNISSSRSNKLR